jgi:hypothetical protein
MICFTLNGLLLQNGEREEESSEVEILVKELQRWGQEDESSPEEDGQDKETLKAFSSWPFLYKRTGWGVKGGAYQPPLNKISGAPLKSKIFGICFNGLKWT